MPKEQPRVFQLLLSRPLEQRLPLWREISVIVAREAGVSEPYVSNYERGRPVPVLAKQRLGMWVERQGAA